MSISSTPDDHTVAIMRAESYQLSVVRNAVEKGIRAIGLKLPRRKRVLLKPNVLAQNRPEQCTTTHPAVVEAVIAILKDNGNEIIIGESSAFYQNGHTLKGFVTSGMTALAARYGARLCAFEIDGVEAAHNVGKTLPKKILLPRILHETDFIINLPKLKTHSFFMLSGAVKNCLGFVPGGAKYEYHYLNGVGRTLFGEKLADIVQTVRPDLSVMDAVIGLEGPGPSAIGKPRHTELILVSANPFALDYAAAGVIGYTPREISSTEAGIKRKLLVPAKIRITGDFNALPSVCYAKPVIGADTPKEKNVLYRLTAVRPALVKRRCLSCGICAHACPLGAIRVDEYPVFDYVKCLNCLHCHYRCPAGAIALKGSFFNPLVKLIRRIAGL